MSLTAFEFASPLARQHAGKGLSELSAAETLSMVEAINAALIELFRLLPIHHRQREVPFTAAPRTVSVGMVAGSDTLSSGTFLASEVGCSVLFTSGGDAAWHQIVSTTKLRLPWVGATGTATAQVLADAARGPGGRIERLLADPVLVLADGHRRRLVPLAEADREVVLATSPRLGSPEFYQLLPAGEVDGGDVPAAWLRLWPLPAEAVRLVALCEIWPARLRAADLTNGTTTIPVGDDAVNDARAFAGEALSIMPGFGRIPLNAASAVANQARQRIASRAPAPFANRNTVGTPYGY